ncbi:MAG: hypothetical protein FRX49_04978 [Trebouxia sp. A1-2]|nr:MAG: hypothetical protein FRX49_04978 [Trebouxia sp. A1-2]
MLASVYLCIVVQKRLISRATLAQHAVFRNAQNCGRAGSSDSEQAYGILADAIANLNSYK